MDNQIIYVCKAGTAILCAFTNDIAAGRWCEEANERGTYRQCGDVVAVRIYLDCRERAIA